MKSSPRELIYLLIVSFLLIGSCALTLSKKEPETVVEVKVEKAKILSPLPVLSASASFPFLSAQAVLAVDLTSGVTLYEKNPDTPYLPASTTKIITALVAMDTYPADEILEVGNIKVEGQKMGLMMGEKITFADLLDGLLIYSANDAAEVLAFNYPGGYDGFIVAMNEKAKQFNLERSYFVNPTGLDKAGQLATARDLIRIAEIAMQNSEFAKIVGTKEKVVKSVDGTITHRLTNINKLIGEVPGVLGVKTGWTENARENLVTLVERDSRRVMIAIMGSQDRFGETKELINWLFANYSWQEVSYPAY